jgi:hypothetical protein
MLYPFFNAVKKTEIWRIKRPDDIRPLKAWRKIHAATVTQFAGTITEKIKRRRIVASKPPPINKRAARRIWPHT